MAQKQKNGSSCNKTRTSRHLLSGGTKPGNRLFHHRFSRSSPNRRRYDPSGPSQNEVITRFNTLSQPDPRQAGRFLSHLEPIQPALAAYCRRALSDGSEVPDALQSAIVNAFREFDLYAEGTNFRAWMFRFVSYEVLNRNRAAARRRAIALPPDLASPRSSATWDESLMARLLDDPEAVLDHCDEAIAIAVLGLPDTERNVFLLRAMGDFKYREIADILEVPVGTVMGLLSRGRERLRNNLAEYAKTHGLLVSREGE